MFYPNHATHAATPFRTRHDAGAPAGRLWLALYHLKVARDRADSAANCYRLAELQPDCADNHRATALKWENEAAEWKAGVSFRLAS